MDGYPKPVNRNSIGKILNQMDNSIYKIKGADKKIGIGFFYYIKSQNKSIPVLVVSYEIINNNYLSKNNFIYVSNNEEVNIHIKFGDKKYINKYYGISIIEIKSFSDKINFIDLDDSANEDDLGLYYNKETIYIIHLNNKNEYNVSFGILNNITKINITLSCNMDSNTNWAPIFNISNNKLIGIYNRRSKYYNKGFFLKYIIDKFIKEFYNNNENMNEINILVNVEKKDINKNIYFLDNYNTEDDNNKIIHKII